MRVLKSKQKSFLSFFKKESKFEIASRLKDMDPIWLSGLVERQISRSPKSVKGFEARIAKKLIANQFSRI